jgi:putative membrane protein
MTPLTPDRSSERDGHLLGIGQFLFPPILFFPIPKIMNFGSAMNWIIRFLLNGLAVVLTAYILPGVYVEDYGTALIVALILAIVNILVKPILIILTIPITILTLGLFLLVINAAIILFVDNLVRDFRVDNFWWALLFSLIMSIFNSLFSDLAGKKKED